MHSLVREMFHEQGLMYIHNTYLLTTVHLHHFTDPLDPLLVLHCFRSLQGNQEAPRMVGIPNPTVGSFCKFHRLQAQFQDLAESCMHWCFSNSLSDQALLQHRTTPFLNFPSAFLASMWFAERISLNQQYLEGQHNFTWLSLPESK